MILVCHGSPTVAEGMATALIDELGVPVWTSVSLAGCREVVAARRPEIAVVDADLAPGREVALCAELVAQGVKPVIVVRPDSEAPLPLLEQGAAGIVVASDGLPGVVTAVTTVRAGHVHLPPHLLGMVLHGLIVERRQQSPTPGDRLESLSPRELEVLELLGSGADTRDIAARLVISPHTAKTHINRVLGKLGLTSRTEAARFAVTHVVRPSLLEATHE